MISHLMCAKSQTQLSLTPKPLRILEIIMQQTIFIYSHKPIVSQTQKPSNIGQDSVVAFSLVKRAGRSSSSKYGGKDENMRL